MPVIFLTAFCAAVFAVDTPRFGLQAGAGALFPLADSASYFDTGFAGQARVVYSADSGPGALAGLRYGTVPLLDDRTLTFYDFSAGAFYTYPLGTAFALRGTGTAGVFRASLENGASDTSLSVSAGLSLIYRISPFFGGT